MSCFLSEYGCKRWGCKNHKTEKHHIQLKWRENPTKVVCVRGSGDGGVKGCGEISLLRFPACLARLFNFSSPSCLFNALTQILWSPELFGCSLISRFSADTNVQYSNGIILTSSWFYFFIVIFPGDVFSMYFLLFLVYSNFKISLPVNDKHKLKHIYYILQ